MQIGIYRFTPNPFLSLITLGLLILFLALGVWQLERADEKRVILENYTYRSKQPPQPLILPLDDPGAWRYRKVHVKGLFDHNQQFLLDNQVSRGEAGYQVLTPFKLKGSSARVLVDRGWVAVGRDRLHLPQISVDTNEINLIGTLYVPYDKGFRIGTIDEGQTSWPRLVQYIDFKMMGDRLGYSLYPVILRLDPASSGGYRREWPTVPFTPERHLGYAVQWFALAAALFVIYLALNIKRTNGPRSAHGQS